MLTEGLPPRTVRRLKRLPKLSLALANNACRTVPAERMPVAVSLGTAWGALSETHDFLQRLFETRQQFPSPTDFIGSVHNAPAGQIAMLLGAKGANVTTSGGDASFEQALLAADLLTRPGNDPILLLGADEAQPVLAPLFDGSVRAAETLADGGGALVLERGSSHGGPTVTLLEYRFGLDPDCMASLVERLGGAGVLPQIMVRSWPACRLAAPLRLPSSWRIFFRKAISAVRLSTTVTLSANSARLQRSRLSLRFKWSAGAWFPLLFRVALMSSERQRDSAVWDWVPTFRQ